MAYTYVCEQFPGMEGCPGRITVGTSDELWDLVELHARLAHGEDPTEWTEDDRRRISEIIAANSPRP